MNNEKQIEKKQFDLTSVISNAIKIPGVKVSRTDFLTEQFKECDGDSLSLILEKGPIAFGCKREELEKKAKRIIKTRSALSTGASFLAGLPGGLAIAAAIPADLLQFYCVALRMAQEIAYLYGEEDLWCESTLDYEKVENQLILYCGVMLGASGASQVVRLMSSALSKQALKKLPQMALTKTFYYPVIKSILKFFGISITKKSFANGVSKIIPVVGGVISGGITLASMLPMGNRLRKTLDKAHFDYTLDDYEADYIDVQEIFNDENDDNNEDIIIEVDETDIVEGDEVLINETCENENPLEEIKKAKELLDMGVISEDEFNDIKTKMLAKL